MSRSIVLSNGELCVALDNRGIVRDIYYPHVGLENHVRGHYVHHVGVWADGRASWLNDGTWQTEVHCEPTALVSSITARNEGLGVELRFSDTICFDRPVFLRRVVVRNLFDHARELKLYFGQQFEIHKMHGSDTAFFDPRTHSMIHYKGRRAFLISATLDGELFQDFAAGRTNFNGQEGTFRDADDGVLGRNAIEHGPADSVIGLYATYEPGQERTCEYWLLAAQSIHEARSRGEEVRTMTPAHLLKATTAYWNTWVKTHERDFTGLDERQVDLFNKSLMFMRAHMDKDGGILAAVDSDMFQYGLDTYSYVWHRDSGYIIGSLDAAGDVSVVRRFFEFSRDTITAEGYFMHKYSPDKSLGSSWHPWYANGREQLPIQEDETAIVMYMLNEHIRHSRDFDLLEEMYEPLVERPAKFLMSYRDEKTKLPLPSYDLWERKRGTSTYTAATVFGALNAAAEMARTLGKDDQAEEYEKVAAEIRDGILTYLWNEDTGLFYNMIDVEQEPHVRDTTIDISSAYGIFLFGVLPVDDERLVRAFEKSARHLSEGVIVGGIARFENDDYYKVPGPATGNPWILTTLWYAEFLIARAKSADDLKRVVDIFSWAADHALPSGVLSEQLDPNIGTQVGAGPLTWTHAVYVNTVLKYLERLKAFRNS